MTHILDRFKLRVYEPYSNTMVYPGDGRTDVAVITYNPETGGIESIRQGLKDYDWEVHGPEYTADLPLPRAPMYFMQCTGVADQQGRLIYEGDVLEWIPEGKGAIQAVVRWYPEEAQLIAECLNPEHKSWLFDISFRHPVTILGNIHQHPELGQAPTPFTAAVFQARQKLAKMAPRLKLVIVPGTYQPAFYKAWQLWESDTLITELSLPDEAVAQDADFLDRSIAGLLCTVPSHFITRSL